MAVGRELFPCPLPYPELNAAATERPRQVCRAVRARAVKRDRAKLWANGAARCLNEMHGRGDSVDTELHKPSQAQQICLDRVRAIYTEVGAPKETSPAGAFIALCGRRPGYTDTAQVRASFEQGRVALPEPGLTPALGSETLRGWGLEAWRNWRTLLRRTPADAAEERRRLGLVAPYSDPALVRHPRVYAQFIMELHAQNLITFKPAAVNMVGLFFVPKKLKNNTDLRLILDTRLPNCDFLPPWHAALPSAAAWSGLGLNADDPLLLAQTDVNNAFYRIGVPAGLEECFLLPQVKSSMLTELGLELPSDLAADAFVSPALTVLAMGFSWSLYVLNASAWWRLASRTAGSLSISSYEIDNVGRGSTGAS